MKNIHIIPTDKPSKIGKFIDTNNLFLRKLNDIPRGETVNIYITSDEEIKEGDYGYDIVHACIVKITKDLINNYLYKKIILTTDQDLIKDGVQAIDDEFLEWFVKNPSCEYLEVVKGKLQLNDDGQEYGFPDMSLYKIIIPQEEPKQKTLEEAAANLADPNICKTDNWIAGAKYMAERMYSEEDMILLLNFVSKEYNITNDNGWFHRHGSIFDVSSKELLEIWKDKNKI